MSKFGNLKDARNRAAEPAPLPSPADARPIKTTARGGKRDDPTYVQTTTYVNADLLHKVKMELLKQSKGGGKRDLSTLVNQLLQRWSESPDV